MRNLALLAITIFFGSSAAAEVLSTSEFWVEGDASLKIPAEGSLIPLTPEPSMPLSKRKQREEFLWPVSAAAPVSSVFGSRWGKLHAGLDIAALGGSPVRATKSGTVLLAEPWGGYGNVVAIQHGESFSLYGHLKSIDVRKHESVNQGQKIGSVGSTGHSFGVHLHFELRDASGRPQNPLLISYKR